MASSFWSKEKRPKVILQWKDERGLWRRERSTYPTLALGKAEANRRQAEASEIRNGKKRSLRKDVSVREAVDLHLAALPSDFGTLGSLEGRLRNRVLEVPAEGTTRFGDLLCRDVSAAHIKQVLACKVDCSQPKPTRPGAKPPKGLRPNAQVSVQTREHVRVAIQGLFTYLKQAKRIEGENPAAELGKLKLRKKAPKFLKPEEMPRFIMGVPAERRLHFAFQLASGARKNESIELQWPDVHEDQGHVILDHTKDRESRSVFLPDWLLVLLRAHRALSTSRWVFPVPEGLKGAGGKQPKWVALHDITKTALRAAGLIEGYRARCVRRGGTGACGFTDERREQGTRACPGCGHNTLEVVAIPIPITFHNLRSTFASWAYAHTRDIRFVQMMLGHSDTKVTERYAAAMDGHMREMANQVQLNPFLPALGVTRAGQGESSNVHRSASLDIPPTQ